MRRYCPRGSGRRGSRSIRSLLSVTDNRQSDRYSTLLGSGILLATIQKSDSGPSRKDIDTYVDLQCWCALHPCTRCRSIAVYAPATGAVSTGGRHARPGLLVLPRHRIPKWTWAHSSWRFCFYAAPRADRTVALPYPCQSSDHFAFAKHRPEQAGIWS